MYCTSGVDPRKMASANGDPLDTQITVCPNFHPQVEYKYDKEIMKGCVIPVVDDKLTLLNMKNTEMASDVSTITFSMIR